MSLISPPSCDLPPSELALDDERSRVTTPRKYGRRVPDLLDRAERESSLLLLLLLDSGRGDKRPLDVDGRDSVFCADFLLKGESARRTQPGESRSFEEVDSVDITSNDIGRRWGICAGCRVNVLCDQV